MENTLAGYYSKKGQALPSVQERAPMYEKNGLGKATDYTGTAEQNTALLSKMQGIPDNNLVSTSSASRTSFAKNSAGLDMMLNRFGLAGATPDPNAEKTVDNTKTTIPDVNSTTDPYIAALNGLAASSDKSAQILIKNIQANKQRQSNSLEKNFQSYKGGLQLLGIQTNAAQATPDLLAGHIQEAELAHHDKLAELDSQMATALAEADQARNEKNFSLLKEKMDYIKELKSNQINELKNLNDTLSLTQKNADIQAHEIYDSLNTLAPADQETFIQAVAKKYKIPVTSLVQALADEKIKRETTNTNLASKKVALAKKTTTTTPSSSMIKAGEAKLTASKGPDGYVDPDVYQQAYETYPGTKKDFLAKFPPNNWVNPANTTLPQYLRSTKKGGSTSTTSAIDKYIEARKAQAAKQ